MALTHKDHVSSIPKIAARRWTRVASGYIGVSSGGATIIHSAGFSGCIGVVMCGGPKSKWGAMAHLNQAIQGPAKDLALALEMVAALVRTKVHDEIVDVLLYYGDPGENMGQRQIKDEAKWLTAANVKKVMRAKGQIIDLRRTVGGEDASQVPTPWGTDFVYDPDVQVVYTAPGHSMLTVAGLKTDKVLEMNDDYKVEDFPFGGNKAKLNPGLKSYFQVP